MRNLKQHVSGSCPRGRNGSGAGGGNMRNLKQHVTGNCPRGRHGSGADMSHSAWRGRRREHAELKIGGCDGMVEKEEEGSRADS